MAPVPEGSAPGSSAYGLRFGLTAAVLGGLTLALVLLVLPRRYVLGSGFRESGVSFPAGPAPFSPGAPVLRPATAFTSFADAVDDGSGIGGPGPGELLWAMAAPLLDAGRYDAAAMLFEGYLEDFPRDRSVLREYAVVLHWAGRPDATVAVLEGLLGGADDREVRLILARTLRDLDRPEAAHAHYRRLWGDSQDPSLALEWSRSWSWASRYDEGIDVLKGSLSRYPGHPDLEVELARLHYYTGELVVAASILDGLSEETLARNDALGLKEDVVSALAIPAADEVAGRTLLFQARAARTEGRLDEAEVLFRSALAEDPGDAGAWQAWADFLQYERNDYPGAVAALLRVADLVGPTAAGEMRIARLELWSGSSESAEARLGRLLEGLEDGSLVQPSGADGESTPPVRPADVQALIGDIRRWAGDRLAAEGRYRTALDLDPTHAEARAGLDALEEEVARIVSAQEGGFGPEARALAVGDTDDYRRLDLRGEMRGTFGSWVWRGGVGHRWLQGFDLSGGQGSLQGLWGDVEVARWFRQGTVRAAVSAGADETGETEPLLGASVRMLLPGSATAELAWDHGPGYLLLGTLQSGLAAYAYDRINLRGSRPLGPAWSLSGDLQVARLTSDVPGIEPTVRFSVAAGVARQWAPGMTWGVQLRALVFSDEAPVAAGRPLFWDPERVMAAAPFLGVRQTLSQDWTLRARASAGAAYMNEARFDAPAWAPQVDLLLGLDYGAPGLRGAAELFYLQGQFQGYRSWGLRFRIAPGVGEGSRR